MWTYFVIKKTRSPHYPGFKLPAKFSIDTSGLIWHGGNSNDAELLKECLFEYADIGRRK